MEVNEKESKEDQITLLHHKFDIFRFDYENQNIESTIDFKNWKAKMKKLYTDKVRIYKCNDCKICFCEKEYHNKEFNDYSNNCPICKKEICCFCYKYIKGINDFSRYLRGYCCLRRLVSFIFFREKFSDDNFSLIVFIFAYIAFIIPYINSTGVILCIIQSLFCNRKPKYPKYYDYHYYYYETKSKYYNTIKIINICFSFCMSICYLSFTLVFMIITFLMSIPFKMAPLTNLIFYVSENASDSFHTCGFM